MSMTMPASGPMLAAQWRADAARRKTGYAARVAKCIADKRRSPR
jgi:hypothetical protein